MGWTASQQKVEMWPSNPFIFHLQDMMDDICQEQFLELSYLNGVPEPSRGRGVPVRGRGAAPPPPPVPR